MYLLCRFGCVSAHVRVCVCVCVCVCERESARAHVCVCGHIQSSDYVSLVCIIVFSSKRLLLFERHVCKSCAMLITIVSLLLS